MLPSIGMSSVLVPWPIVWRAGVDKSALALVPLAAADAPECPAVFLISGAHR